MAVGSVQSLEEVATLRESEVSLTQTELAARLSSLADTIPQLELPDFFNSIWARYPNFDHNLTTADMPADPLDPYYNFEPADLWADWTISPDLIRYDSPFLEQLEQKCRDIIVNAPAIVMGGSLNGLTNSEALFEAGHETDARVTMDTIKMAVNTNARAGFPMPTHITTQLVEAEAIKYYGKRDSVVVSATESLSAAMHAAIGYAIGKGIVIEELRSRVTKQFTAVYNDSVDYQISRYREAVEYSSKQMDSALKYARTQIEENKLNEELNADAYEDAVQEYDERYKRAFRNSQDTFKAAEEDFTRRIDGLNAYVQYYATYLADIISTTERLLTGSN